MTGKIGVVGAGLMGTEIALVYALAGYDVLLSDRTEDALKSALGRPRNQWHYGAATDVATLAAAYGWGLANNHPYRDGNKRIAFLTMAIFVELNGHELEAPEEEVVQVMLAVADRRCTEGEFAEWIRAHLIKKR